MFRAALRSAFAECPQCRQKNVALVLAVALLAVAARVAGPAGVAGVDRRRRGRPRAPPCTPRSRGVGRRPSPRCLARVLGPNRCPIADARQVFDGDPATGAFGQADDRLADAVVLVAAEVRLSLRRRRLSLLLRPLGPLASGAASGLRWCASSDRLDGLARVGVAVAVGGDVDDAQVDAEHVGRRRPGRLRAGRSCRAGRTCPAGGPGRPAP